MEVKCNLNSMDSLRTPPAGDNCNRFSQNIWFIPELTANTYDSVLGPL